MIEQVEAVAIGYLMSPSIASLNVKPKVINLLKVQSQQQVQIDVRFAEVNRLSLREIGASFTGGEGEVGANTDPNANGFKSSYGRQGSDFGKFLFRKTYSDTGDHFHSSRYFNMGFSRINTAWKIDVCHWFQ